MIRRSSLSLLLLIGACSSPRDKFNDRNWKYVAAVETHTRSPSSPTPFSSLPLDAEVFRRALPSLADLRLVSPSGIEIPFVFGDPAQPPEGIIRLRPRVISRIRTAPAEAQFIVDFGALRVRHDSLTLCCGETKPIRLLRVETSTTQASWDLFEATARDRHGQSRDDPYYLELTYPACNRRYVRLTVAGRGGDLDWLFVDAALRPVSDIRQFTELAAVALLPAPAEPGDSEGETTLLCNLPFRMPPALRFEFEAEGGPFKRELEVQSRSGEGRWTTLCGGTIEDRAGAGKKHLDCPGSQGTQFRILARNLDGQPSRITRVILSTPARTIFYRTPGPGQSRLHAGNPAASAPSYPLDRELRHVTPTWSVEGRAYPWWINPAYRPPAAPSTGLARGLVAPLMAAIVLVVLASAFFLVRKPK